MPSIAAGAEHAWHLYVVTHPRRDDLQQALRQAGVETLIHYPIPPFQQKAYAEMAADADRWPLADGLARQLLSLPIGPHLTEDDAATVVEAVREAAASLGSRR